MNIKQKHTLLLRILSLFQGKYWKKRESKDDISESAEADNLLNKLNNL